MSGLTISRLDYAFAIRCWTALRSGWISAISILKQGSLLRSWADVPSLPRSSDALFFSCPAHSALRAKRGCYGGRKKRPQRCRKEGKADVRAYQKIRATVGEIRQTRQRSRGSNRDETPPTGEPYKRQITQLITGHAKASRLRTVVPPSDT